MVLRISKGDCCKSRLFSLSSIESRASADKDLVQRHKETVRYTISDFFANIEQLTALLSVEPIETGTERPVFADPGVGTLACLRTNIWLSRRMLPAHLRVFLLPSEASSLTSATAFSFAMEVVVLVLLWKIYKIDVRLRWKRCVWQDMMENYQAPEMWLMKSVP